MASKFYSEPEHAGYCRKHGRYLCDPCREAEERERDWGIFEWRSDGRYTRGTALRVYKSKTVAERASDKYPTSSNVVVRSLEREGK